MIAIQCSSGESKCMVPYSKKDFDLYLRIHRYSKIRMSVLDSSRYSKPISLSADEFRADLAEAVSVLGDERVNFKYSYSVEPALFNGLSGPFTGRLSSFELDGEDGYVFSIDSGIGFCDLIRTGVDPVSGRGTDVDKIDVRDKDAIHSSNRGAIKIHKKRVKPSLRNTLLELSHWAAALKGDIQILLCE